MKCKLCEARLLEYLYGELGEEDAAAMERHLEASEPCRREYEGLVSVLETVAEAEEAGPPPAVHTRIMGHAEEAEPGRRSLWAWMFRPAVTTAVIGAIAGGVYFTSLRHKPPSYLDERILSEESLLGKSKLRSTPSPPEKKGHAPRDDSLLRKSKGHSVPPSSSAKVDLPRREAKEEGFLAGLAEPPVGVEQEEAAQEHFRALEKSERRMPARPSRLEEPFIAADAMDTALAPARKKAWVPPAEEDPALEGGVERARGPAYGTRAAPMALRASPDMDLVAEKKQVPDTIARALDLASEGNCADAKERVEAYATNHPKEEACGAGWLEVARCYEKKGDTKASREMAEKALAIPAHESDARAFIDSLPSSAE